ncbi:hypothetical protein D3C75_863140 [compost metagenome]
MATRSSAPSICLALGVITMTLPRSSVANTPSFILVRMEVSFSFSSSLIASASLRRAVMLLKALLSWPISSCPYTRTRRSKSPSATRVACLVISLIGLVMVPDRTVPRRAVSARAINVPVIKIRLIREMLAYRSSMDLTM